MAEFLPNFALVEVSPKRPNFRRISHSGRFRQNGRMNPDEFMPNFVLRDVSDETAEFPSTFALGDVSPEVGQISADFRSQGRF
ncbi:MAG: hypothetical protein Q8881_04400 [Sweet potato little leaf phytoplasma]|nr:hypothetical protein [Sweet potato little leaf phytoplasma]